MIRRILEALIVVPVALVIFSSNGSCGEQQGGNDDQMRKNVINQETQTQVKGQWGGQGVSMQVGDTGATLEFDCARATITQSMALDANNKFAVKGFFARERGGPTRQDEQDKGKPATFTGSIEKQIMLLTIKEEGADEPVGTFELTYGKSGRIRRCL
jgi:hypothetical protein